MNVDGSVIGGYSGSRGSSLFSGFIWTEESGMQDVQQWLIDEHGLGDSLEGWHLEKRGGRMLEGRYAV